MAIRWRHSVDGPRSLMPTLGDCESPLLRWMGITSPRVTQIAYQTAFQRECIRGRWPRLRTHDRDTVISNHTGGRDEYSNQMLHQR